MLHFTYSVDKDIQNFLKSIKSVNNTKHTRSQLAYIEKFGMDFTPENLAIFIQDNNKNIEIERTRIETTWRKIEAEFISLIEKMFDTKMIEPISVFLTTNQRCTYSVEENYFFVYAESKNPNAIIMHELFHFYTWHVYGDQLISKGVSQEVYNNIKESLTVLLNTDFTDLMNGKIDEGYPQHHDMRARVSSKWSETKNMNSVIESLL